MTTAAAREKYAKKNEAEDLRRAFNNLDTKGDGKIDAEELNAVFTKLGHKTKRNDIVDMIWEVDEDCDEQVSWQEFQAMYQRCRNDKTGFEPRRLFNVVEFLINDKDNSGTVSLEEAMQILYLRFGREKLDSQLQDIFGTSDTNSDKNLTLTEFLHCLNVSQVKQLRSKVTAKTYKPPAPSQKRKS
ncbi:calmodulin [Pycnococcus provasolii]